MTSFSNISEIIIPHYSLEWSLNFEAATFSAVAELTLLPVRCIPKELILDTKDLMVTGVESLAEDETGTLTWSPTPFRFVFSGHTYHADLGSALHIFLGNNAKTPQKVRIRYNSTCNKKDGTGIRWEEMRGPTTTPGKAGGTNEGSADDDNDVTSLPPLLFCSMFPNFMSSRALFPCQDTTGSRFTYSITITLPRGVTCVMPSNACFVVDELGMRRQWVHWRFEQSIPIGPHQIFFLIGLFSKVMVTDTLRVWCLRGIPHQEILAASHSVVVKEVSNLLGEYNCCIPLHDFGERVFMDNTFVHNIVLAPRWFPYTYVSGGTWTVVNECACLGTSFQDIIVGAVCDLFTSRLSPQTAGDAWIPSSISSFSRCLILSSLNDDVTQNQLKQNSDADPEVVAMLESTRSSYHTAVRDMRRLLTWSELTMELQKYSHAMQLPCTVVFPHNHSFSTPPQHKHNFPHHGLCCMCPRVCDDEVKPCALTSLNVIPAAKGSTIWHDLREIYGEAHTKSVLHKIFLKFCNRAVQTEDVRSLISDWIEKKGGEKVWRAWCYNTSFPPSIPNFNTALTDVAVDLADFSAANILEDQHRAILATLSETQIIIFLSHLYIRHGRRLHESAFRSITAGLKGCKGLTPLAYARWHALKIAVKKDFSVQAGEYVLKYPMPGWGSVVMDAAMQHGRPGQVQTFVENNRAMCPLLSLLQFSQVNVA